MNGVGALFAIMTARLEDMHAMAVEGQASGLSRDEGLSLVAVLRTSIGRLERDLIATNRVLNA